MDLDGVETCQEPVKTAVPKIAEDLDTITNYSLDHAHSFYLLNKFDEKAGDSYLDKIWEQYSGELDPLVDYMNMPFVAKLVRETPGRHLQEEKALIEIRDEILTLQQMNGKLAGDKNATTDLFWFLVQFDDISKEIERTKQYVLSDDFLSGVSVTNISEIILSLYDLSYIEHRERIREIGEVMIPSAKSEAIGAMYDPHRISRVLMALSIIPQDTSNIVSELTTKIHKYKQEVDDWWWNREDNIPHSHFTSEVDILLGLIAVGYGPTISKEKARRERKIEQEQQSKSSPEFTTTLPSTRFEDRRTEIKSKIEHVIQSCEDSLLISTLQMDMLHDDIFNRLAVDEDISVRILTNTGTASGPRTKMKKAVMNEMVNRLGGNVREDRLVHTRMVIGDDEHAVISTADLTRDQLLDSYNAGIYTRNVDVVQEATSLFESMWDNAEPRGVKK